MPELYSGFPGFPGQQHIIPYPEASKPQAWACNTPIGIFADLLGLERSPGKNPYTLNNPILPTGVTAINLDLNLNNRHTVLKVAQSPNEQQAHPIPLTA